MITIKQISRYLRLEEYRAKRWIRRRRELMLLIAALLAIVGIWVFLELADEVAEGDTRALDQKIILALRSPTDPADPIGPRWIEESVRDLSALGSTAVLAFVTAAVVGYLLLRRHYHGVMLLLAATVGGALVSVILKGHYARPRPDLVSHLSYVESLSFPSGHSMLSAIVYLTLGALLARFTKPINQRIYFILVAAAASLLVGFSRVYLGVHYPTDVVAGWAAGLTWAVLCWMIAYYLQQRGRVEPPD